MYILTCLLHKRVNGNNESVVEVRDAKHNTSFVFLNAQGREILNKIIVY